MTDGSTWYASPSGGGDGKSPQKPFLVAGFWPVAKPGATLCLLDGVYKGRASMIGPTAGMGGTACKPVTVKAMNDGGAEIGGEDARIPICLRNNDYFIVEGVNAHNSSSTVVLVEGGSHNIIRRVCGWDARDGNCNIFGIHRGDHNLIEDCAGWGVARKIFSSSYNGNYTTFRRCWGRWEGSHVVGPKMVYAVAYNNHDTLFENCVGTWDARRMRKTYTLMTSAGNPYLGPRGDRPPEVFTDFAVQAPWGIFSYDRAAVDLCILGCMAYTRPHQRVDKMRAALIIKNAVSCRLQDCIADIDRDLFTFAAYQSAKFTGTKSVVAHDLTAIGPGKNRFDGWTADRVYTAPTPDALINASGSILKGVRAGATMLHRYVNGALTDEPLWPWPMDQRIHDAMILAGYDDPAVVSQECGLSLGGKWAGGESMMRYRAQMVGRAIEDIQRHIAATGATP